MNYNIGDFIEIDWTHYISYGIITRINANIEYKKLYSTKEEMSVPYGHICKVNRSAIKLVTDKNILSILHKMEIFK